MTDFNITKHFTYKEFCKSDIAEKNKIINNAPIRLIPQITIFSSYVLERIRSLIGAYTFNSAYRCKRLNTILNGSNISYHLQGLAVDIKCIDKERAIFIYKSIIERNNIKIIPFKELILSNKKNIWWVHVSFSDLMQLREDQIIFTKDY